MAAQEEPTLFKTLETDCLVDGFFALYEECTHENLSKIKSVSNFVNKYCHVVTNVKKKRMKSSDFELKDVIGRGHFGEVRVVKHKMTGNVYAMKVICKSLLLAQPNISFFEEERNIMASASNPWITTLHYAFQDSVNLYLVMDFYPGGDLLSLLSRHDNILDESMCKFYLAETAFAINSLHTMGYIHRDIKPENVLLDHTGHIKLADFGSAAKMDSDKKVMASMPVGTPDYVAPELLRSINKSTRTTYGPEVDWWSLGVCAYEMMFGALPFTNKQSATTVDTYASIMNFKKSLRFPSDSDVSSNAIDVVKSLLTDPDSRLSWEDIKSHPFFSGISWDNLQHEIAAFVPSINGLDDTSNFDEFDKIQSQPDLEALKPKKDFVGRDLPFVGFTFSKQSGSSLATTNDVCSTEVNAAIGGISVFDDKDKEIARLKELLEKERNYWASTEDESVALVESMRSTNQEIKDIECDLQEAKLEEVKANVVLMEADYEKIMTKLMAKERKLEKVETALEEAEKKLEAQRFKLSKERRKSMEDHRKDLTLMEVRDETWQSLLDDKQFVIDELRKKVEEYEHLLEAYEESEEKQAAEVTQLQHKMNTSLLDVKSTITMENCNNSEIRGETQLHVDSLQHTWCSSKKKLVLQVTLQAGRCSFLDNKTMDKLQELQKMVDQYVEMAKTWRDKEDDLKSKLSTLEKEKKILIQKEGLGRKLKENLMEKVSSYQQEVYSQRSIIKELQTSMTNYLAKGKQHSEVENQLKDMMQTKLELEKEVIHKREETDRLRQSALAKANEMEAVIAKWEEKAEDYKKRYECQVAVTEEKVCSFEEELSKVTSTRQRLERRETTLTTQVETLQGLVDDRTAEVGRLEGRIADLQTHLQTLQQRNSNLQVQVEKLQKSSNQNEEQKTSKIALNFQIGTLTQSKDDLEHRLTVAMRDKHSLEDKLSVADKEKDRLNRRIERLEKVEMEKRELESKLDRIHILERDNRRLQTKADRVNDLEKDKLTLEEKIQNLELDVRKEKVNAKMAIEEKSGLETKMEDLKAKKKAEDSEGVSILKVRVSLLESVEKEKILLETEVKELHATMTKTETDKEKLFNEKEKLEGDVERLSEEKNIESKHIIELKEEIAASDRLSKTLNGLITRLESSVGIMETDKSMKWSEKRLSREVDRLKLLVDNVERDEQNKEEKNVGNKRSSVEEKRHFFDRLEKMETQKLKQSDTDECQNLKEKLKAKEEQLLAMRGDKKREKNEVEELQNQLEEQSAIVQELREQMEDQSKIENDLVAQLEKLAAAAKTAEEEKWQLAEKLKNATAAPGNLRKSGDFKFEKMRLEKKIEELTEERDELKKHLDNFKSEERMIQSNDFVADSEFKKLKEEYDEYKKEMDIRLGASKFLGGDIPAYLRHELNESNLALSEARSLLSAAKRQELELRERNDKLQRSLDNKAVENAKYLQNAKDAMTELKSLMSQHDTLRRQNKILDEKHSSLQKQQGSNSSETIRLLEEANLKEKQCAMERKKTETLTQVCGELEQQIKDLEHLVAEADNREAEWECIKKTYEKAVNEREEDLDGATERIQAISMARCQTSEKAAGLKQQLDAAKALHKADIESLNHKLREEKLKGDRLELKIDEMMEKESATTEILERQTKEVERMNQEKLNFKQDLTEALSDSCNYRKENLKLRKHLDEAMEKFELILGENVSLENFTEALQGLHFLDKYKFESTIGQQMKLIDHLQDLYAANNADKKKKNNKLFSGKGKGNGNDTGTLQQRCLKCNILQQQLERLQTENIHQANELLNQKSHPRNDMVASSSHNVKANLVVNVTPAAMKALGGAQGDRSSKTVSSNSLASVESSSSSTSSVSSSSSSKQQRMRSAKPPTKKYGTSSKQRTQPQRVNSQRMHHNIPHRFTTGLNSRATKCDLCLGSVHFVRQASKCQECKMVVHLKCASSVPPNCGLPTEYVKYFALMTSRINQDLIGQECELDQSAAKMEGWLKVPRIGKPGWENRYCILEGTWLTFHMDDHDSNPVDSFDLDPPDADITVHSAVTKAELTNTANTDLHYIIRLDQDPLTTCWPGRYVYLMTTSFQDKQRWVASLEAVVKAAQCKHDMFQHDPRGKMVDCQSSDIAHHIRQNSQIDSSYGRVIMTKGKVKTIKKSEAVTVLSLKDAEMKDINCTLTISSQLVLVGTEDGLYAFNPEGLTCKQSQMTQLSGFGSVHQMALAKGVDLILILTGPERRLIMLENRLVKSRMSRTLGGETTPFSFRTVEGLHECTVFDVGLWNKSSYLCVGTPKKVYLMKFNPSLSMYCVRKEFPCTEPCSCVCIADNYAIVGTDRFYKINMEHPSLLDFVDRQDSSLAFAAYDAANHKSFPLAIVQVSPKDLPLEFLLCFHEFGVFVDHRGQRSRAQDVKWSGFPLAFAFVDPFLYVTYFNTVQATVVPTDRSTSRGRQTIIDFPAPRYLGPCATPGSVYISTNKGSARIMEIVQIRGQEDYLSYPVADKENMGSAHGLSPAHITFSGQIKTPRKGRLHALRREGSLTSLNSNNSSSTFASVESDV